MSKQQQLQLPKEINILGFNYKIIEVEPNDPAVLLDGKFCAGTITTETRTIAIAKYHDHSYEDKLQTLMHEVVHAIENHFDCLNTVSSLTEWQIDMIGTGLATILLNNKGLFK